VAGLQSGRHRRFLFLAALETGISVVVTTSRQNILLETNLNGRSVTVMGLGTFGGAAGAVEFLCRRGARVTVSDLRDSSELAQQVDRIDKLPGHRIDWRLGEHRREDFVEAELVVVNPAVPIDSPWLELATRCGARLTTEIGLFWEVCPARTIAVTGSNGKSTTTAMIHSILEASGQTAWLGGNIGGSLLPRLDSIGSDDWVVLELSSFQLEHLDRQHAAADIAVVTNFTPNHLDRHGTLDAYRHAKQAILRWQSTDAACVLSELDPDVAAWPVESRRFGFGQAVGQGVGQGVFLSAVEPQTAVVRLGGMEAEIPLGHWVDGPGFHNRLNAAAATAAALLAGADISDVRHGLEQFIGLPHRLQLVARRDGLCFYNDSLATTPESVEVALASFDSPVVLLAGGYDKRVSLEGLAESIAGGARAVALMGQTAEAVDGLLDELSFGGLRRVCGSLEEAVGWAVEQSESGDNIVLSPGCASYDWFRSFRERGDEFTRLVGGTYSGTLPSAPGTSCT